MAERKNFDSDFCGSLPLHHINSIQDYGYLLILDINDLSIVQASENCAGILNNNIQQITETNISTYLAEPSLTKIKEVLNKNNQGKFPLTISLKPAISANTFHCLAHFKPDFIILELEKENKDTTRSFTTVFQEIKYIGQALEQAQSIQQVCEVAIHELRKISGFDGVLMYQFDKDWNGTVLAEEKDDRLEKYIGQTFPASDVPKQARQLYLKNPYRLIPNRDYQPVRLYPIINPVSNTFIDLSDCNLRGVAAVHLEYMKNMGVKASMSIRVIYKESLWGLISCHHIDEKYLNYDICSLFEWLSDIISNRITLILNKEEYTLTTALQEKRVLLTDKIYAENHISSALLPEESLDILSLFNASGAVVALNGRIEVKGVVPLQDALDNLILWLEGKNLDTVFSTAHLADIYDEAQTYANEVSGLLVIPIDSSRGEFIVCFRPEVVEDIHWGGDPNHAINFTNDGKNYHPRNSFKLWKQTVYQHSLPWKMQEIEAAESLRSFLFEFRTKQLQQ